MRELKILLPGWMVEDGSHETFVAGQVRKLALEIRPYPSTVKLVEEGSPGLVHDEDDTYVGIAEHRRYEKMSVFDFGCVAGYKKNCGLENGLYAGKWHFGLDPYHYKNGLDKTPHSPNLFNEYEVTKIELDVTPLILDQDGEFWPDENNEEWASVQQADLDTSKLKVVGGDPKEYFLIPNVRYLLHLTRR